MTRAARGLVYGVMFGLACWVLLAVIVLFATGTLP